VSKKRSDARKKTERGQVEGAGKGKTGDLNLDQGKEARTKHTGEAGGIVCSSNVRRRTNATSLQLHLGSVDRKFFSFLGMKSQM